jgi:hypothetical protein
VNLRRLLKALIFIPKAFFDRRNDGVITRAAAQISGQSATDLMAVQFLSPVLFNQRGGCHHKARRADAALYGAFVYKSLLHRGQFIVSTFTLHRAYGAAVGPYGQKNAGIHGDVVNQYRTGAALSHAAALLDADQPQLLPQNFEQRLPNIHAELPLLAVYRAGNGLVH